MSILWHRPRRRLRGEKVAVIVMAVLLMLGSAGLTAMAVTFTSAMPAISTAR